MIDLWRMWRSGGMSAGFFPDPGGAADQSCWLLDAFHEMERMAGRLEKGRG